MEKWGEGRKLKAKQDKESKQEPIQETQRM
jgi:hypothetical protein